MFDECSEWSGPFVVFGASKSGTTWVQRILDAHPEVRCHFQLQLFPVDPSELLKPGLTVFDGGGSPFSGVFESVDAETEYRLQTLLLSRTSILRKSAVDDLVPEARATPLALGHLHNLHRKMVRGAAWALLKDTEDKRVFGTKAYTDLEFFFSVFPKGRLIHVIRDGRDVCVSKRFHDLRRKLLYLGDESSKLLQMLDRWMLSRRIVARLRLHFGLFGEDWFDAPRRGEPLFRRHSLEKLARDWRSVVHYISEFQGLRPDQFITVRYEDLLDSPTESVCRLLAFLGVGHSEGTIGGLMEATRFEKLRGGDRKSFFRGGRSGDWRSHFTPQDVVLFKQLAGDVLLELGYENSPDWSNE